MGTPAKQRRMAKKLSPSSPRWTYDAVLLDYMMPGMTGLTVLQRIKQRDPSIPVVMITGHVGSQVAAMALLAGAQDCLYKPFTCMEFKEVLECLVGTPSVRAVVSGHDATR